MVFIKKTPRLNWVARDSDAARFSWFAFEPLAGGPQNSATDVHSLNGSLRVRVRGDHDSGNPKISPRKSTRGPVPSPRISAVSGAGKNVQVRDPDAALVVPEFNCKSLAELRSHLQVFASLAGFETFGFGTEVRGADAMGVDRLHFIYNAPADWRDSIERAVLSGEAHNMVRHSSLMLPPVGWSAQGHLAGHTIVDDLALDHVRRMSTWSVRSGVLCPAAAPELVWAGLAFFSSTARSYTELDRVLPACALYASNFCFWFLQLAIRGPRDKQSLLSNRERDCLQHAASGKTSLEIGIILSISPRTVEGYISNACAKLNARGRQAAISKATEMQLIGGRNSLKDVFERQRDEASTAQVAKEHEAPVLP